MAGEEDCGNERVGAQGGALYEIIAGIAAFCCIWLVMAWVTRMILVTSYEVDSFVRGSLSK